MKHYKYFYTIFHDTFAPQIIDGYGHSESVQYCTYPYDVDVTLDIYAENEMIYDSDRKEWDQTRMYRRKYGPTHMQSDGKELYISGFEWRVAHSYLQLNQIASDCLW